MRSPRAALIRLAVVVLAAIAAAAPAAAEKENDLVRLVSPRPGATLVGGSAVVLEWRPGPGLAALRHAEEWEVFLSLDGGRTFLSRITPHLDIRMRRVTVHVPRLPSNDVRLLLRMGDERDEREQLLPGRYHIVLDHAAPPIWRPRQPLPGEAARPGAPGVVVWVEGGRDGSQWQEYESDRTALVWEPAFAPGGGALSLVGPLPAPAPKLSRTALVSVTLRSETTAMPRSEAPLAEAPAPQLSSLCRRNV